MSEEFLFVFLFSLHVCLLFDVSPLQKRPVCKLNFIIGSVIATIPTMTFSYLTDISAPMERFSILAGITFFSSILVISSIQRFLDYEINF